MFLQFDFQKSFVKHFENLMQHVAEEFIDYRYHFQKLKFTNYNRYRPGIF